MDRGAWWATVHEVPKSWTWLSSKHAMIAWHPLDRHYPWYFTKRSRLIFSTNLWSMYYCPDFRDKKTEADAPEVNWAGIQLTIWILYGSKVCVLQATLWCLQNNFAKCKWGKRLVWMCPKLEIKTKVGFFMSGVCVCLCVFPPPSLPLFSPSSSDKFLCKLTFSIICLFLTK